VELSPQPSYYFSLFVQSLGHDSVPLFDYLLWTELRSLMWMTALAAPRCHRFR
jgi:hypothetical protein